ncbi:MAG TPA: S41 family peptidase [Bacilli bacterium]|nr:S41 family peptidase [Bacilli bacterium]
MEKKEKTNNKNNKSIFNTAQVVTIALSTAIISIIMGIVLAESVFLDKNEGTKYSEEITNFIKEYEKVKENYYQDIDDKDAMKNALQGVINSLDDYSTVVDDSLSNTLTTRLQGTYQGFGIEIANDADKNIIVVSVMDNSPAKEAGMQPGDVIKKINNEEIKELTTTEFVTKVKNSKETKFTLLVERDSKSVELKLERKLVTLDSVATEVYERNNKKVGYIYVSLFAYNTDVQFSQALEKLEKQGIDSLIVDLRYNTGGHLTAVENMMSEFLDKSHVIYQIESKKGTKKYYSKTDKKRDYKVVVLVNNSSASASEMFTATMKEEYGATIMGVTTW